MRMSWGRWSDLLIQVDTREKPQAIEKIITTFDQREVKWFRSKLVCGDYIDMDNPRLAIDRKQNLQEVCGNLCQQHERFRAELIRANHLGIKLVLLIEHSSAIKCLSDVRGWNNPRRKLSPYALDGWGLYDRLMTIKHKYGVSIYFCDKRQTGDMIIKILTHGTPFPGGYKTN